MRKRTKKEFEQFKESFAQWKKEFGLTQYYTYTDMKPLKDAYATMTSNEMGKICHLVLSDKDKYPLNMYEIEDAGQHEAVHLLLSRLVWLYANLYGSKGCEKLLEEEEEAVVRRIQTALNRSDK